MKGLIICMMVLGAIGGMVSELYKQKNMTQEEYEAHGKKMAEHAKGIALGIVVGSISTMVYLLKDSKGGRK